MADYSSGFLYFATLPDAILCREGEMGRYVPCNVRSWGMENWKSKDYFKGMLSGKTVTVWYSTYIHLFAIFSQ